MKTLNKIDTTTEKTSLFEKISYGMGDMACNVVFAFTTGLITYFYTNVIGISAATVGIIMLFSRIFDGISDVMIGLIMDKVHSKHGRGLAWVLWMAIPYGVSAVALFCIPADATAAVQAVYIFITYNLCTTVVYTALNLPYGAMAPLMTRDEQDLAKINLFLPLPTKEALIPGLAPRCFLSAQSSSKVSDTAMKNSLYAVS